MSLTCFYQYPLNVIQDIEKYQHCKNSDNRFSQWVTKRVDVERQMKHNAKRDDKGKPFERMQV